MLQAVRAARHQATAIIGQHLVCHPPGLAEAVSLLSDEEDAGEHPPHGARMGEAGAVPAVAIENLEVSALEVCQELRHSMAAVQAPPEMLVVQPKRKVAHEIAVLRGQ